MNEQKHQVTRRGGERAAEKKMWKRMLAILSAAALLMSACVGCGKDQQTEQETDQGGNNLFHDGLVWAAPADRGRNYGAINTRGEWVVEPGLYSQQTWFSEGLAAVRKDGKWGFINSQGEVVIELEYEWAYNFSEGLAAVEVDDRYGYINAKGEMVIEPQFEQPGYFHEGLAAVKLGDRWGYINNQGRYVINPKFDQAEIFSQGIARVEVDGLYGIINTRGEYVFEPQFIGFWGEHDGQHNLDLTSSVRFMPPLEAPTYFSDGLALVMIEDRFGYVNTEGKCVFYSPGEYGALSFSEGLAGVALDGKWGFINTKGEWAIEPQFDRVYSFSEGLAVVKIGNQYGYINTKGEIVINPRFDGVNSFSNGLAAVWQNHKFGYINTKGEFVIEPKYASASLVYDDGYMVVSDDGWGDYIIDRNGNRVGTEIYGAVLDTWF